MDAGRRRIVTNLERAFPGADVVWVAGTRHPRVTVTWRGATVTRAVSGSPRQDAQSASNVTVQMFRRAFREAGVLDEEAP